MRRASCSPRARSWTKWHDGSHERCATDRTAVCTSGLLCRYDDGVCAVPAEAGESCSGFGSCAPGLTCVPRGLGQPGRCQDLRSLAIGAEGEPCRFVPPIQFCRPELSCSFEVSGGRISTQAGTCMKRAAIGERCVVDTCAPDAYCKGVVPAMGIFEGTCAKTPRDGEPCAVSGVKSPCALPAFCMNGTCREMRTIGDACDDAELYWSEECVAGKCAPPVVPECSQR